MFSETLCKCKVCGRESWEDTVMLRYNSVGCCGESMTILCDERYDEEFAEKMKEYSEEGRDYPYSDDHSF